MIIVINIPAARQIRKSPGVVADMQRRAEAIRQATGDPEEFALDQWEGKTRTRVRVRTDTPRGAALESGGRVLSRAIDAGRR